MSIWLDNYGFTQYGLYGALDRFGSLSLTDSSPAQSWTEPLDVDLVKDYLKVPFRSPADSFEDMQIGMYISAAREQAEILQGRDLVPKSWDLTFDYWPSFRIRLRDPLKSVDLVTTKDFTGIVTTLNNGTDFIVDTTKHPGIITPPYNMTWPAFSLWPTSSILIRFTSGYSLADPFWNGSGARIKNGMLLLISAWYNNHLPFEKGVSCTNEYPYAVTSCLSYGAMERAR
ncbi:MAG TPA: hypothetical protein VK638_17850 [Edaphobacter sp.]|nr:hypothetical protein [Edaphobacter sp.]